MSTFEAHLILDIDPARVPELKYTNRGRPVRTDADQLFAANQVVKGRWHKLLAICWSLYRSGAEYSVEYKVIEGQLWARIEAENVPYRP